MPGFPVRPVAPKTKMIDLSVRSLSYLSIEETWPATVTNYIKVLIHHSSFTILSRPRSPACSDEDCRMDSMTADFLPSSRML